MNQNISAEDLKQLQQLADECDGVVLSEKEASQYLGNVDIGDEVKFYDLDGNDKTGILIGVVKNDSAYPVLKWGDKYYQPEFGDTEID